MSLKISHAGLIHRSFLVMKRDGIKFYQTGMFFGARRFRFFEIDHVLMAADETLSFQVRGETFSILTHSHKPKHQLTIAAFLEALERSRAQSKSSVYYSP